MKINFGGASIANSETSKILGIVLDQNISWKAHVSAVIQRCYATLSGLTKFTHRLSYEVKKMIIESLIHPHIHYCLAVWGDCSTGQRRRIQKVINHCARVVYCAKRRDHVRPMLRDLEWLNVGDLLAVRDVATVYRALRQETAPPSLRDMFMLLSEVSPVETRQRACRGAPQTASGENRSWLGERFATGRWLHGTRRRRPFAVLPLCRRLQREQ